MKNHRLAVAAMLLCTHSTTFADTYLIDSSQSYLTLAGSSTSTLNVTYNNPDYGLPATGSVTSSWIPAFEGGAGNLMTSLAGDLELNRAADAIQFAGGAGFLTQSELRASYANYIGPYFSSKQIAIGHVYDDFGEYSEGLHGGIGGTAVLQGTGNSRTFSLSGLTDEWLAPALASENLWFTMLWASGGNIWGRGITPSFFPELGTGMLVNDGTQEILTIPLKIVLLNGSSHGTIGPLNDGTATYTGSTVEALELQGQIVAVRAVPEPGTYGFMLLGLMLIAWKSRGNWRTKAEPRQQTLY